MNDSYLLVTNWSNRFVEVNENRFMVFTTKSNSKVDNDTGKEPTNVVVMAIGTILKVTTDISTMTNREDGNEVTEHYFMNL